jgi:UDP-N-acetylmuramate--alanine ligase
VTNIDADHMETYQHSMAKLKQSFVQFTQRMPFYGLAILCVDDANVRDMIPFVSQSVLGYGLSEDADIRALNVQAHGAQMKFKVTRKTVRRHGVKPEPIEVTLNLPGLHNVRNALAAIAVATELGVSDAAIVKALAEFKGVGRRFTHHGEVKLAKGGTYTVIDDYGHHPVEMAATLSAARGAFPGRRLVLAFQPHRYTRTRDCFGDFVNVLKDFDALVLTEVYPAGEPKILGADGESLMKAIQKQAHEKTNSGKIDANAMYFHPDIKSLPEEMMKVVKDGDVVITMGAGSISSLPLRLVELGNV